jgi:glycine/D-amino acid oxidase-like deaminating enzyme
MAVQLSWDQVLRRDRAATDVAGRSFWLGQTTQTPEPPLAGHRRADVAIIGGGFTGLWTAIHLKAADPSATVALLESRAVGYGASGRNGGFGMTMIGRSLHDLVRKVGPERAKLTHLAMQDTLRAIEAFVAQEGIEAMLTRPGVLTVSNGPEQDIRITQDLEAQDRLGLHSLVPLEGAEAQEWVHTPRIRRAHYEAAGLLLNPAALVRGLRDAAKRRGVEVFEGTPVLRVEETNGGVRINTPEGWIDVDRALIATNAYAAPLPVFRRWLFTIYAYIIVTEPLTAEQWRRVGWERRMGIEDRRIMPHFHRPTPDGRILWGGRDAPHAPEGPNPRRDRFPRAFARLEETFRWTFPQLSDVRIAMGWGGPVAGTVQAFASVGPLTRRRRLFYAAGYAGHGVGPSHLVARIAAEQLLDRRTELALLPMATERPLLLPPGPVRPLLLYATQAVLQRADDRSSDRGLARLLLRWLQ